MNPVLSAVTEMPEPQFIMSADGLRIATYSWGDDADPTVLAVHGFASSARDNWVNTGWVSSLVDAGFRVITVDHRGHGQSEKPHDPSFYSIPKLAADLLAVLDTYLVDDAAYLGYSLGGRVGWHLMAHAPEHIAFGVLGGIPDGMPLRRLLLDQARAYLADGTPLEDATTRRYVTLAERLPINDMQALLALVEGMQAHEDIPPAEAPPLQPTLIATGTKDPIFDDSQALASRLAQGSFFAIPNRGHVQAPGSREFREVGVQFLAKEAGLQG